MKIGVFIGSFDPVHYGHIKIMETILKKKIVNKILIVPTLEYWNKTNITSLDKRIAMLKMIKNKNIIVDETHNKIKYTYDLLEQIKKENPTSNFYLIIGSDNAINLNKWYNYEMLIKNPIIVIKRNNYIINKNDFIYVDLGENDISSTIIRNNVKNKKDIRKYTIDSVCNYIYDNNLYK